MSDVMFSQGHSIHFHRNITGILAIEWNQLLYIISTSSFTHNNDKIAWWWEHSGKFTVRSIYKLLNFRGVNDNKYAIIWSLSLLPKIRIFLWLLLNNRILTKNNLRKRGWDGDIKCQFCPLQETISHLFLHCQQAQKIWFWLGPSQQHFLDWHTCSDIFIFSKSLSHDQPIGFLVVFSAFCWTLWKHRNELCFQQVSTKSTRSIILLISLLLNIGQVK